MSSSTQPSERTLQQEMLRDAGGALLFGVPLVYTMEIWWLGETSSTQTVGMMTLVAALISGLIRYVVIGRLGVMGAFLAGLRCTALSLLLALGLSFAIGVLTLEDSLSKVLGELAAVGIPLALGAALGAVLFANPQARDSGGSNDGDAKPGPAAVGRDITAGALGATFIALPIAPTGEVPLIAAMTDLPRLIAVVPVCVLLCYIIVYASGFLEHRGGQVAEMETALWATLLSTAVGLFIATVMLYTFGVLDTTSSAAQIIGYITALSIPAVIGAAAGRIAAA